MMKGGKELLPMLFSSLGLGSAATAAQIRSV